MEATLYPSSPHTRWKILNNAVHSTKLSPKYITKAMNLSTE